MAMTLELIQQLRGRAAFLRDKGRVKSPQLMEQAANELEAHLTQPVQAMDVGAIREVISEMESLVADQQEIAGWSAKLTRVLAGETAEGWRGPDEAVEEGEKWYVKIDGAKYEVSMAEAEGWNHCVSYMRKLNTISTPPTDVEE